MAGPNICASPGWLCVRSPRNPVTLPERCRILHRHPTEPQCSYDPVEGLTLAPETDPLEKIRQLEEQISALCACRVHILAHRFQVP